MVRYCDKIRGMSQAKSGNQKVVVGLSGGVDSAVSAWLLKKQGYEVEGVYLRCWDEGSGCQARQDRKDALRVALKLGIAFKVLEFESEYKKRVIDRFYEDYRKGLTPNPDVWCNSEIKFGLFLQWAIAQGFAKVATGHYARVAERRGEYRLMQPEDESKDQTYFLYRLGQSELRRVLFPVGGMKKDEVRKLAERVDLPVAGKKDSQGICFVGDVDVQEFLRRRLEEKEGVVVNESGEVVGTHKGVWFYTIGQRGGWDLDSGFQKGFEGELPKLYVLDKDIDENRLVVGRKEELGKDKFRVGELSWIRELGEELGEELGSKDLKVRIRNLGELVGAEVEVKGESLLVDLEEKIKGVAAGQAAVFYLQGECLGGGVIK